MALHDGIRSEKATVLVILRHKLSLDLGHFSLPHGYVFTFVTLQILLKGKMFGVLVAKCFNCS